MMEIGKIKEDRCRRSSGFTLTEVIAVLIILGILAVIAVSRSMSTQNDLITQADIVKSHLRFAQLKALSDDTSASWGINFGGSSYTLYKNGVDATPIKLPSEDSSTHTFPNAVTVTSVTPSAPVTFDRWGSPTGDVIIVLAQGSQTSTINIAANTGYITP